MAGIRIESGAARVIARLRAAGYSAYAVGGCVRDALLGDVPSDWDICTAARPEQTLAVFGEANCIPTGVKHGTITVRMDGGFYEVTTFRTEGTYSDGRHPDEVAFVTDVRDDLSRRDFTINAMAYSEEEGLIDPFGGQEDLLCHRVLRAVGEPMRRFEEDALRIMRLLRFAARFSLAMDGATLAAARALAGNLRRVSAERIREELVKLLLAPAPSAYLPQEILGAAIPALREMSEDGYARMLRAADAAPREDCLRLAAFVHPLGAQRSRAALKALRCSNEVIACVGTLLEGLDVRIETEPAAAAYQARRLIGERGLEYIERLAALRRAVVGADASMDALLACAREAEQQGLCCRLGDLAVAGGELMRSLQLKPGREVGRLLKLLLEQVLRGRVQNEKEALIAAAKALREGPENVES